MNAPDAIRLDDNDNVATAVRPLEVGETVFGVTVKEVERMLVTTGSGNDSIDNSYAGNFTSDYIDTGAGNDTIVGGAGFDTLIGGSGDDTITATYGTVDGGSSRVLAGSA